MYYQLQRSMMNQIETMAKSREIQRQTYSNPNITLTPQFEGNLSITVDADGIINQKINFVDKKLAQRNQLMNYGGLKG